MEKRDIEREIDQDRAKNDFKSNLMVFITIFQISRIVMSKKNC
jgi:hypothetical protein